LFGQLRSRDFVDGATIVRLLAEPSSDAVAICDDDREVAFGGLLQQAGALKDLRHPVGSTAGTVAGPFDLN
jgi:hypothetical protein